VVVGFVVEVAAVVTNGIRLKSVEVKLLFDEPGFANKLKREFSFGLIYIYGSFIASASEFDVVIPGVVVVLANLLFKSNDGFERIELLVSKVEVDGTVVAVGLIICEIAKSCSKLFVDGFVIELKFKVVLDGNVVVVVVVVLVVVVPVVAALFNFNELELLMVEFKFSPVPVVTSAGLTVPISELAPALAAVLNNKLLILLISLPCKANKEFNSLVLPKFKLLRRD